MKHIDLGKIFLVKTGNSRRNSCEHEYNHKAAIMVRQSVGIFQVFQKKKKKTRTHAQKTDRLLLRNIGSDK